MGEVRIISKHLWITLPAFILSLTNLIRKADVTSSSGKNIFYIDADPDPGCVHKKTTRSGWKY